MIFQWNSYLIKMNDARGSAYIISII